MLDIIGNVKKEDSDAITTFVNPFVKNGAYKVEIEIYPDSSDFLRKGKRIEATIRFRKSDTTGHHSIYADTLEEIVQQIKTTLEKL